MYGHMTFSSYVRVYGRYHFCSMIGYKDTSPSVRRIVFVPFGSYLKILYQVNMLFSVDQNTFCSKYDKIARSYGICFLLSAPHLCRKASRSYKFRIIQFSDLCTYRFYHGSIILTKIFHSFTRFLQTNAGTVP
jgi:hypothetical protein